MSPTTLEAQRHRMVEEQLAARGITDERVLQAMRTTPRHCFVPSAHRDAAYEDHPIPIGQGQTISQPYMVALMTAALRLQPEDRVLEIGAGSGYQTAVLAQLALEVFSIERHGALARSALDRLTSLGYDNVAIRRGDGTLGWPEHAPYDAILVTAGGPGVPRALRGQLAMGGRLLCPVGTRDLQQLVKITREPGGFRDEELAKCVFVPLVGQEGWREDDDR